MELRDRVVAITGGKRIGRVVAQRVAGTVRVDGGRHLQ